MTVATDLAMRFGARIAPDGTWAATAKLEGELVTLELWDRSDRRFRPRDSGLSIQPEDQLTPLTGRALLICSSAGTTHTVSRVDVDDPEPVLLATLTGRSVRLLAPAPGDPDHRPWAIAFDGSRTTLARLDGPGATAVVAELPGAYTGAVWAAPAGQILALGQADAGRPISTVALDLATGTVRTLFEVTARSNDQVQAYSPPTGLTVVHTDAGGVERLGYAYHEHDPSWTFPDELAAPSGLIESAAVDPDGGRILAHVRDGVRSHLHVYDVHTHRCRQLPMPPGSLAGTVVWSDTAVTVPWTAPGVPLDFVDLHDRDEYLPTPRPAVDRADDARVISLPGASGPVEAIVYGDSDWIRSPQLVIALHGGPLSAWQLAHDPFLECVAGDGVTVLAINQRGSTGYGYWYAAAIRDGWGGADLDDVTAIGKHLRQARGGPAGLGLCGSSYGGYLALLAACTRPAAWQFCVAMSAFSAPQRLHRTGSPGVRQMIEQLGGLTTPPGYHHPHDLIDLAPRLRARTLLLHGGYDERVPIAHARRLASALIDNSRAAVRYAEIPEAGHDVGRPYVWNMVRHFIHQPDTADMSRSEPPQ